LKHFLTAEHYWCDEAPTTWNREQQPSSWVAGLNGVRLKNYGVKFPRMMLNSWTRYASFLKSTLNKIAYLCIHEWFIIINGFLYIACEKCQIF
jgi:hypothetical protein